MDDIIREIRREKIEEKLVEINNYHPNLKFTMEKEQNGSIPFLDMRIIHIGEHLTSTWYRKDTDTGLTMNFHSLAPMKYKRSVVTGLVYRIHYACSTWENFHKSLVKAKTLLENNQYPPSFYNEIIEKTLDKIYHPKPPTEDEEVKEDETEKKLVCLQYRGKVTEKFERSLKRIGAPCKIVSTIKKIKTVLPSLKVSVEKPMQSGLVYKITCSRCLSCYVGQTTRHLLTRVKEHKYKAVGHHFKTCNVELSINHAEIIAKSTKSKYNLMTLEALLIQEIKPTLNTKDKYRSCELIIKI